MHSFPPIGGVAKSLFFVTHNEKENKHGLTSKMNNHEAEFLVLLAKYLLLNGYKPQDITILATYAGQTLLMLQKRKKYPILKDLPITNVDNYQGEESKIILLSLVRCNDENKIGFLSLENRVCVALSRAREGLYIIGNIDLLCRNSKVSAF